MRRYLLGLALALLALPALAFNGGVYTLAATQITTALTSQVLTPITSLDGATAVTVECSFAYGSGGTTASATVQTTLDGSIWRDIARCDFTTATAVSYANLSGLTAKAITGYSALASAGVNDGLIGNQLRAVITSTGTYVNTTLSVRASVR